MDTVLGSIEKGCKRRKCMDTLIQDVVAIPPIKGMKIFIIFVSVLRGYWCW